MNPTARRAPQPARTVVVGSGKGGVGKSTVTLNVAIELARAGADVGVLDADVYGPDIALMSNLRRTEDAAQWTLWSRRGRRLKPVERYDVKMMSVAFLIGEKQTFPWQGPTLPWVVRQLLYDVDWGDLDYLFIDLPPGTADLQAEILTMARPDGAVVVVTPQDVAHADAKRFVSLLRDLGVDVLGGVENMRGLVCPHCSEQIDVFGEGIAGRSIWADGVRRLGTLPLSASLVHNAERGVPLVVADEDSDAAREFRQLAGQIRAALE
jgi:ATP-binding protein involved in chromosome partitioning